MENDCWQECANTKKCTEKYGEEFINKECSKLTCSCFVAKCVECKEYTLDCEICKHRYDKTRDPDYIRKNLREQLKPSKNYGYINKSGVHSIVCDGSLLGEGAEGKGVEVITTGRRLDYWEFYNMTKDIVEKALSKGAYVNERCSIHVHLLASYYENGKGANIGEFFGKNNSNISELERPLPKIVIANLHQLCRKYQNAITWMSMGMKTEEALTRWEKYRVSILDVSPVQRSIQNIIEVMEQKSNKLNGKYGWINYMFLRFNDDEDLTRFHVELRSLDGMMSASVVTAMTCLFYALVIKAIEISRYGVLEVGDASWTANAIDLKNRILNNCPEGWSSNRLADTSSLTSVCRGKLIEESLEMLYQLKHILLKSGPAYDVLEQIAYKPVALRRVEGKTWPMIEDELAVYAPKETQLEKKLSECIDTRLLVNCTSENEWKTKIFSTISEEEGTDVSDALNNILFAGKNEGEYIWSNSLGTILKV
jgi:hypothetical protein